ncbi:type II toxin-antitoxin system Phd/YefM family antitoxin [Gudongella sp. SC589]|jgi:antitoxin Phd|uniref:type II toxin-antitoxin system Phd/YefM family antitoxin n=1 Tax=Gudongella sp. SC589 TaxID=3385990 RepID=UPI003904894A
MKVNLKNLVSITEANQNFSKVARMVDKNGSAVIMKNNKPRYILIEYSQISKYETAEDQDIDIVAEKLITKYMDAFEELAK